MDANIPSFNEWDDNSEKLLSINVVPNEDSPSNQDFETEQPPSLPEAIQLLRRLKLLSSTHHPELHPLLSQLQSKLAEILLDSKSSRQKSILDFFSIQ